LFFWQILLLLKTILFFFRECFANPNNLFVALGFKDLLLIDQNNC